MALADPLSITIGGTTHSLPRLTSDGNESVYATPDGAVTLKVAQRLTGRAKNIVSTTVRLEVRKISTDVLQDTKSYIEYAITRTFTRPLVGFSETEMIDGFTGSSSILTATTNANLKKVLGRER